jgi:hypothetical protein
MAASRLNPLNSVDGPGSSEIENLVFCEHSTSSLIVSKVLMEAVFKQVTEGVRALPRGGGAEVGGLLVGAKSCGTQVTVEQVVPISTEPRFGPAFHLSPTDVEGIKQAIASAHRDQTHTVIGFYRSRTRGDAIPRESDQEILTTLARVHPAYEVDFRFFLIITPLSEFVVNVSISQRCDAGWHEWREFAFRTQLRSVPPDVSDTESSRERTKTPGVTMEPAQGRTAVSASAPADPPRPPERAGRRPRSSLYGVIGLAVLVGATGANFWITTHRPETAPLAQRVNAARETVTGRKDEGPKNTPLQSRVKVRLPTSESGHSLHLRGRGSVVVLALDAAAAFELQKHPDSLAQLVRNGSLFSVPGGTAITKQENKNGVIKVLIMEGTMAGREGWAPAGQALATE